MACVCLHQSHQSSLPPACFLGLLSNQCLSGTVLSFRSFRWWHGIPGCRLTSSLTSFLTSPVLLPLHIWIHSFIHPSIHSKDAYRQDAYPHTAMAWRGENHLLSKSSQFNRRARATDDEDNFVNTGNLSPSSWPHILALSVPFSGADNSLQPMGSGGEASELRLHWLSIFLSVVWNKWFYPPEPM